MEMAMSAYGSFRTGQGRAYLFTDVSCDNFSQSGVSGIFKSCRRSKRVLLTSEIGMLLTYALCVALIAALVVKPIKIDYKVRDL
jgi:hypothetical protein